MKRRVVAAAPSAITLLGLFFAFLALVWAPVRPYWACNAIVVSAICDMLDGRLARLTKTQSAFGTQLDSLADVISFGVAPAYLLYTWGIDDGSSAGGFDPWLLVVFLFVAAGALRLARFNLLAGEEHEVGWEIIGLSIPVAALLVTALVMTSHELELPELRSAPLLLLLMVATAALMVSRLPFPSYKRFRSKGTRAAFFALVAFGCALLVLELPGGTLLFSLLALYVLVGVARALVNKFRPSA
jgi:CDP-diacylglycerol---serine O-phosphatidyltransferase